MHSKKKHQPTSKENEGKAKEKREKKRRARELDSTKPYKCPPKPRKAGYKSWHGPQKAHKLTRKPI